MGRLIAVISKAGLTLHVLKTALAAAAAWLAATMLFPGLFPYFAPLAALLTVQVSIADTLKAACRRFAGIVGGVIISMLVGHWLAIGTLSIFIMILLGMAIAKALDFSPSVSSQIGMTSLLVLAIGHGHGPGYAIGRIVETLIGSLVAILVNVLIFPPDTVPAAEKQVSRLCGLAAETLANLGKIIVPPAAAKRHNGDDMVEELIRQTGKGIGAVRQTEESLRYSPLTVRARRRLRTLAAGMERLEFVTIQIRGIRKGLMDLDPGALSAASRDKLKTAIETTAACLSCYGARITAPSPPSEERLGRSIAWARARQRECLADMRQIERLELLRELGAILTDLHRIVDGLAEEP